VSRPFPSWSQSILTEIYLCHACSCHEIEDGNGRAGRRATSSPVRFSVLERHVCAGSRDLMIRTEAVTEIPLRFCSFHSRFVSRQPPPPNGQTLSRRGGSWPATASGAGTHRDSIPTLARPALAGDTHWYVAGWEDVGDGRGVSIRC
jgi:hypothetical protein